MNMVLFCVITFGPIITKTCEATQNDCKNLSFVQDEHTYYKKLPEKVVPRPFTNSVSF